MNTNIPTWAEPYLPKRKYEVIQADDEGVSVGYQTDRSPDVVRYISREPIPWAPHLSRARVMTVTWIMAGHLRKEDFPRRTTKFYPIKERA